MNNLSEVRKVKLILMLLTILVSTSLLESDVRNTKIARKEVIETNAVQFSFQDYLGSLTSDEANRENHSSNTEIQAAIQTAERNNDWISTLATILGVVIGVVALFSTGFVVFVLNEMHKMREERKLNESTLKEIAELGDKIKDIYGQIHDMKNVIRDASLSANKIVADEEYAALIEDLTGKRSNMASVNSLKDFIWRERISLADLQPLLSKKELLKQINDRYDREFCSGSKLRAAMPIGEIESIIWAYKLNKGMTIDQLVDEKKTSYAETEKFVNALLEVDRRRRLKDIFGE